MPGGSSIRVSECAMPTSPRREPAAGFLLSVVFIVRRVGWCVVALTVAAVPHAVAAGSPGSMQFNIPAQSLGSALEVYARTTGTSALVDQELIAGRRSSSVRGLLGRRPGKRLQQSVAVNGSASNAEAPCRAPMASFSFGA